MGLKKYTQEDLDRLEAEKTRIEKEIWEARASIRMDKVGYLDEYWRKQLVGKLCIPYYTGAYGTYLYIERASVTLKYDQTRELKMEGLSFRIDSEACRVLDSSYREPSYIQVGLDENGRLCNAYIEGYPEERDFDGRPYSYRIIEAADLSDKNGKLKASVQEAFELRLAEYTKQAETAFEKFRRDAREVRKATEKKLAEEAKAEEDSGNVAIP